MIIRIYEKGELPILKSVGKGNDRRQWKSM